MSLAALDFNDPAFGLEVVISKSLSGNLPAFPKAGQTDPIGQADPHSAFMDSSALSIPGKGPVNLGEAATEISVTWGLNANPMLNITFTFPAENFMSIADHPSFLKNNVIGIRFKRCKGLLISPFIFGMTRQSLPAMTSSYKGLMIVEGFGLLDEASRRHVSSGFRSVTPLDIVASLAVKYGLTPVFLGGFIPVVVPETEQNVDDFTFLQLMAYYLNAVWFLDEGNLVFIQNDYLYQQTPMFKLTYGQPDRLNSAFEFPMLEFTPFLNSASFDAGAHGIRASGVDLDTGLVVAREFIPLVAKMGTIPLNSSTLFSETGTFISDRVLKPAPGIRPNESGVIIPLNTRSSDSLRLQSIVNQRDTNIRAFATTLGFPSIRPGMMVEVVGVGNLLGGNWIVEEVQHTVKKGDGYKTHLSLVRNALGMIGKDTDYSLNNKERPDTPAMGITKYAEPVLA